MKSIIAITLPAIASICHGGTLRISILTERAGEGVEQMALKTADYEESFFVKTEAIVEDTDVEEALVRASPYEAISVKLNRAGAEKLRAATSGMRFGRDRLAIVIDGKLISAPIVMSALDSSFDISGFRNLGIRELDDLARKISGRPPRREGEEPQQIRPNPKAATVPFTEAEYQNNKAMREKMGMFHLDSVPTMKDLNNTLRNGMSRDEVLALFGKPFSTWGTPKDMNFSMLYEIAPEKRPGNPKREALPDGFQVNFQADKVSKWSLTYSNALREEKVTGREAATLNIIIPEIDFSAKEVNYVKFVEGIVILDPQQSVNNRDLEELISMAMLLSSLVEDDAKAITLNVNCDFMKALAHNFSEIADIAKSAEMGRINIKKLTKVISPYALREKALPVRNR